MSFNVYEDQENRIHNQRRHKVPFSNSSNNFSNKNVSQVGKRTALSTLSVNSSVRVQPSRAAKQGICYDSGAPQQLSLGSSHNDSTRSRSSSTCSSSQNSSSLPFTIFEDNSSKCSAEEVTGGHFAPSASMASLSSSASFAVKRKGEVESCLSNKENVQSLSSARKVPRKTSQLCLQSPEEMDISISENFLMAVDTPSVPGEEILHSREDDIYDVPEYAADIYKYLRSAELCHKPRVKYMSKQNDITAGMRWILVDWLVEVAEEYELQAETLFLAVSYVDRFLSQMSVKRDKLQLVGTTAMFIAAKYEEIYPPDVGQFAYITDNTYRKSQILRMEHLILKVLSFDMAVPTAYLFVNRFCKYCKCSKETTHLAYFLAELSMLDCDPFLRYLPSMIGASAVALANYTQGKPAWPDDVAISSQYELSDLKECYINLNTSFCKVHEQPQHSIRDKYKSSKWNSVSNLSPRAGFPWSPQESNHWAVNFNLNR